MANKVRDLRRLLATTLSQIVQTLSPASNQSITKSHSTDEQAAFDYIQSAPLEKLALIDRDLRKPADQVNDQLLNLALGPNLDDKLLFPHMNPLIKAGQVDFGRRSLANITQVRAEANYCLYVNQLYANGSDSLGTLGSKMNERGSMSSKIQQFSHTDLLKQSIDSNNDLINKMSAPGNWHKDLDRSERPESKDRASTYKRLIVAAQFSHLHHVNLLNTLLNTFNREEDMSENQIRSREVSRLRLVDTDDEEEEETSARRPHETTTSIYGDISRSKKHSPSLTHETTSHDSASEETGVQQISGISRRSLLQYDRFSNDYDQLLAPLGSVDLMIAYIRSNASSSSRDFEASLPYDSDTRFKNVSSIRCLYTDFLYNKQRISLILINIYISFSSDCKCSN